MAADPKVPGHDEIVGAFKHVDPRVTTHVRGGEAPLGYWHIHGPSQNPHPTRCTTHWITVERYNGTVSLRRPLALAMGGFVKRPEGKKITEHPLGMSFRQYGAFDYALDAGTIAARWPSLHDFAREVISRCRTFTAW
jgi:hypothetical protein